MLMPAAAYTLRLRHAIRFEMRACRSSHLYNVVVRGATTAYNRHVAPRTPIFICSSCSRLFDDAAFHFRFFAMLPGVSDYYLAMPHYYVYATVTYLLAYIIFRLLFSSASLERRNNNMPFHYFTPSSSFRFRQLIRFLRLLIDAFRRRCRRAFLPLSRYAFSPCRC